VRENVEEPARTTADSLLRSFRNIHNQPVDAPICWLADRSPTANLAWGDIERMWLFRTLPGLLQLHHPQTVPRPIEFSSTERRQALAAGHVVLHPVPPLVGPMARVMESRRRPVPCSGAGCHRPVTPTAVEAAAG